MSRNHQQNSMVLTNGSENNVVDDLNAIIAEKDVSLTENAARITALEALLQARALPSTTCLQNESERTKNMYHFAIQPSMTASVLPIQLENLTGVRYLKRFQIEALNFLLSVVKKFRYCVLNDESGLGKTATISVLLSAMETKKKCLIICKDDDSVDGWLFHLSLLSALTVTTLGADGKAFINSESPFNIVVGKWTALLNRKDIGSYNFDVVVVDNRGHILNNKFCKSMLKNVFEDHITIVICSVDITSDVNLLYNVLELCGRSEYASSFEEFEQKFRLPVFKEIYEQNYSLEDYYQKREILSDMCKQFRIRRCKHHIEDSGLFLEATNYQQNLQHWLKATREANQLQELPCTNQIAFSNEDLSTTTTKLVQALPVDNYDDELSFMEPLRVESTDTESDESVSKANKQNGGTTFVDLCGIDKENETIAEPQKEASSDVTPKRMTTRYYEKTTTPQRKMRQKKSKIIPESTRSMKRMTRSSAEKNKDLLAVDSSPSPQSKLGKGKICKEKKAEYVKTEDNVKTETPPSSYEEITCGLKFSLELNGSESSNGGGIELANNATKRSDYLAMPTTPYSTDSQYLMMPPSLAISGVSVMSTSASVANTMKTKEQNDIISLSSSQDEASSSSISSSEQSRRLRAATKRNATYENKNKMGRNGALTFSQLIPRQRNADVTLSPDLFSSCSDMGPTQNVKTNNHSDDEHELFQGFKLFDTEARNPQLRNQQQGPKVKQLQTTAEQQEEQKSGPRRKQRRYTIGNNLDSHHINGDVDNTSELTRNDIFGSLMHVNQFPSTSKSTETQTHVKFNKISNYMKGSRANAITAAAATKSPSKSNPQKTKLTHWFPRDHKAKNTDTDLTVESSGEVSCSKKIVMRRTTMHEVTSSHNTGPMTRSAAKKKMNPSS